MRKTVNRVSSYLERQNKKTRVAIFLAFGGILLMLLILITVPFVNHQVNSIYPKDSSEASASRSYLLGLGGMQTVADGKDPLTRYTGGASLLAQDADVILVHAENYGIPWTEFETSSTPPANHPWTLAMDAIAQDVSATGKPIYLALFLGRKQLAPRAENNGGQLKVNSNWGVAECYDFSQQLTPGTDAYKKRTAYLNYARWMMQRFNPTYVGTSIEFNKYWEDCTNVGQPVAAWNAIVALVNETYDTVKAMNPSVKAFPTFVVEDIYGYDTNDSKCAKPMTFAQCQALQNTHYEKAYAALSGLKRDWFAVSTYPYLRPKYDPNGSSSDGNSFMKVADIPSDWFTRAGDRGGERTILAETGWNSTDLIGKLSSTTACYAVTSSTPQEQANYFNLMFSKAQISPIDMIVLWSAYDVNTESNMVGCIPFASAPNYTACQGDLWCIDVNLFRSAFPTYPLLGEIIFKAWGTIGIRSYDKAVKNEGFNLWHQTFTIPYGPGGSVTPTPTTLESPTPTVDTVATPTPTSSEPTATPSSTLAPTSTFTPTPSATLTPAPTSAIPAAPSNVRGGTIARTSIQVLWNDNSTNETNFYVRYKKTTTTKWTQITRPSNTTSYTINGLSRNTSYNVEVRACNGTTNCSSWVGTILKTLR